MKVSVVNEPDVKILLAGRRKDGRTKCNLLLSRYLTVDEKYGRIGSPILITVVYHLLLFAKIP